MNNSQSSSGGADKSPINCHRVIECKCNSETYSRYKSEVTPRIKLGGGGEVLGEVKTEILGREIGNLQADDKRVGEKGENISSKANGKFAKFLSLESSSCL